MGLMRSRPTNSLLKPAIYRHAGWVALSADGCWWRASALTDPANKKAIEPRWWSDRPLDLGSVMKTSAIVTWQAASLATLLDASETLGAAHLGESR